MPETPAYAIVGRGRWAKRMHSILRGEGRRVIAIPESRRRPNESDSAYRDRLGSTFKSSNAQIAWLAVPPGNHIPAMIETAVQSGLHVVAEKPWLCSRAETQAIRNLARTRGRILAIDYEYCLMSQVEAWRRDLAPGSAIEFHGRFHIARPDHTGLAALENLGSHLFSILEYCTPDATVAEMDCAYEQSDVRRVWLEKNGKHASEIDLLSNTEPIIQRFIARFEDAVSGREFALDLEFASRVTERMEEWKKTVGGK